MQASEPLSAIPGYQARHTLPFLASSPRNSSKAPARPLQRQNQTFFRLAKTGQSNGNKRTCRHCRRERAIERKLSSSLTASLSLSLSLAHSLRLAQQRARERERERSPQIGQNESVYMASPAEGIRTREKLRAPARARERRITLSNRFDVVLFSALRFRPFFGKAYIVGHTNKFGQKFLNRRPLRTEIQIRIVS